MMLSRIARSLSRSSRSSLFNGRSHGSDGFVSRTSTAIANQSTGGGFVAHRTYNGGLGFNNSYFSSIAATKQANPSFSSIYRPFFANPRFFSTDVSSKTGNEIKEGNGVSNEAVNVESRNSPSFLNRVYHAAVSPLFHLEDGIREIIADYVHNEMTRNFVLVCVRLYLLIVIKDVILALLY